MSDYHLTTIQVRGWFTTGTLDIILENVSTLNYEHLKMENKGLLSVSHNTKPHTKAQSKNKNFISKKHSTNLALGSSCSLTAVRSLSVNFLHLSSRENIYGERGCDRATKSMSNITLFLRTSSSCRKILALN